MNELHTETIVTGDHEFGDGPSVETSVADVPELPHLERESGTEKNTQGDEEVRTTSALAETIAIELKIKRDEAFNLQFGQTHKFALPHETIEYAMIEPEEITKEEAGAEWAIFIGGFASIKETYKTEMLDLARSGKRVLFLSPDKGVSPTDEDADYFNAQAGALPSTIRDKACAVALLLEHLGATNVNIIGHSLGGAVATALAGMRPNMVDRLILDNPAGLIGEDSVKGLLRRVANEVRNESHGDSTVSQAGSVAWDRIKRIARLPIIRTRREILGIAKTDIRPILEHIQKEKLEGHPGPEIILINSNNDQIFKAADVERGLGPDLLTKDIDRWVMHEDINAGHGKSKRQKGELLTQVFDDDTLMHPSVIHQIITEKGGRGIKNAE